MVLGLKTAYGFVQDMTCLSTMWFHKTKGSTHKDRLESFYGPQAHACRFIAVIVDPDRFCHIL